MRRCLGAVVAVSSARDEEKHHHIWHSAADRLHAATQTWIRKVQKAGREWERYSISNILPQPL